MNSIQNRVTLETYEGGVDEYIQRVPNSVVGVLKDRIHHVLSYIGFESMILEIGSGTGRDADYIESLGYYVQRSDYAESFISFNKAKGKDAIKLNAVNFFTEKKYDLIFSNAVLIHFIDEEVGKIIENVFKALRSEGIFAFSLKKGVGEGQNDTEKMIQGSRYFNYRLENDIRELLEHQGFTKIEVTEGSAEDRNDWMLIIAQK